MPFRRNQTFNGKQRKIMKMKVASRSLESYGLQEMQNDDMITQDPFSPSSPNVLTNSTQDGFKPFPAESVSVDTFASVSSIMESSADHLLEPELLFDECLVNNSLSIDLNPTPINPYGILHVVKQFDIAQCDCFHCLSMSHSFFFNLSKIFSAATRRPRDCAKDTLVPKAIVVPRSLQIRGVVIPVSSKMTTNSSTKTSESKGLCASDRWNACYQHLKDFSQKYGHCHVPIKYKENPLLSRWIKRQRHQWKLKQAGKPSAMTISRFALLKDLGFLWDVRHATWDTRYRATHGHCHVSVNYKEFPKLVSPRAPGRKQVYDTSTEDLILH
jgi:hypothetical protein